VIGWLLSGIGIEPAAEMPGATKRDGGKIASGKTARKRIAFDRQGVAASIFASRRLHRSNINIM
jgi:hypothetical protein